MISVTVVANAEMALGGEFHLCTQMRMLQAAGCDVTFRPTPPPPIHRGIAIPPGVHIGPQFGTQPVPERDVLFFLANNAIMPEPLARNRRAWEQAAAGASWRFLLLNWQIRDARLPWFSALWDRVGFLSTTLRDEWCSATGYSPRNTFVHAPAVDLE